MMRHLGFTVVPFHRPLGRFGEFWENFFSWGLLYTYNAGSLRSREFLRLQRTELWMLADDFIRRYAPGGPNEGDQARLRQPRLDEPEGEITRGE